MINRTVATLVTCLLSLTMLFHQSALAHSNSEKVASLPQKIKAGIIKLGIGQSSTVNLRLRNKTKLAGYISEIGDDSFVVTELESGRRTKVEYPDVIQIKGNNLTTRTKVIIGVAIAVGVAITLYMVRGALCDGC